MQTENIALGSATSDDTSDPTINMPATSLEQKANNYLDITLQKEIELWFKKNTNPKNISEINEPIRSRPVESAVNDFNLGNKDK